VGDRFPHSQRAHALRESLALFDEQINTHHMILCLCACWIPARISGKKHPHRTDRPRTPMEKGFVLPLEKHQSRTPCHSFARRTQSLECCRQRYRRRRRQFGNTARRFACHRIQHRNGSRIRRGQAPPSHEIEACLATIRIEDLLGTVCHLVMICVESFGPVYGCRYAP